MGWSWFRRLL